MFEHIDMYSYRKKEHEQFKNTLNLDNNLQESWHDDFVRCPLFGVLLYPGQECGDASVDSGVLSFSAADTP